MNPGVGLLGNV